MKFYLNEMYSYLFLLKCDNCNLYTVIHYRCKRHFQFFFGTVDNVCSSSLLDSVCTKECIKHNCNQIFLNFLYLCNVISVMGSKEVPILQNGRKVERPIKCCFMHVV